MSYPLIELKDISIPYCFVKVELEEKADVYRVATIINKPVLTTKLKDAEIKYIVDSGVYYRWESVSEDLK